MITELKWDTAFFKKKIGRLTTVPSKNKIRQLIQKAQRDGYAYIMCRLSPMNVSKIQRLESIGFYVTDVGVVWERELSFESPRRQVPSSMFRVREAAIADVPMLKKITKRLFKESRFYNDPFFGHKDADRFYLKWIENLVQEKKIKTFIVDGSGFITCRKVSRAEGNIPLVGVVPARQGRGVGRSLVFQALKWFRQKGVRIVTVRTQVNNVRAMNFYMAMGFRIKHVDVTMGLILN